MIETFHFSKTSFLGDKKKLGQESEEDIDVYDSRDLV